jgi:uncharacterized protein
MPTEKCNFRCKYCYEQFHNGLMSRETIDGINRLLEARSPSLRILEIGWFGGEPLLALNEVCEISSHASKLSSAYSYEHHGSMSTNGSLLDVAAIEKLVEVGVRTFQISLDGTSDHHNRTRTDALGRGTYDKILGNLKQIHQTSLPFSIVLRLHVTSQNYQALPLLASQLVNSFGNDSRFKVYFKEIEDLGGPGSSAGKRLKTDQDIHWLETLLPIHMVANQTQSNPQVCYAAAGNSFVIRSTGDICKCTVALDNPLNVVGKISRDGTIATDSHKYGRWVSTLFDPINSRCPLISLGQ